MFDLDFRGHSQIVRPGVLRDAFVRVRMPHSMTGDATHCFALSTFYAEPRPAPVSMPHTHATKLRF
jgi:hypothetical protein